MPSAASSSPSTSHDAGSSTAVSSSYFSHPAASSAASFVSGLYKRFTDPSSPIHRKSHTNNVSSHTSYASSFSNSAAYLPSISRTASPYHPPPLTPLTLRGFRASTPQSERLLSPGLAEEIRLLLPPRLQLADDWDLIYSVEQHGSSLATLYAKCERYSGKRCGFVLVVRDSEGTIFGAYLSDAPHPHPHYFGTGECFLWRCTMLAPSTLPLSSATAASTDLSRSTISHASTSTSQSQSQSPSPSLSPVPSSPAIRFRAFPYSGINDYLLFCEPTYLSLGGGDGHYGLWLDDVMERGVSEACPTFGNEPLSECRESGGKFGVLGVELWCIGG